MSARIIVWRVLQASGFSFGLVGASLKGIFQYLHCFLNSSSACALPGEHVVRSHRRREKEGARILSTWHSSSSWASPPCAVGPRPRAHGAAVVTPASLWQNLLHELSRFVAKTRYAVRGEAGAVSKDDDDWARIVGCRGRTVCDHDTVITVSIIHQV